MGKYSLLKACFAIVLAIMILTALFKDSYDPPTRESMPAMQGYTPDEFHSRRFSYNNRFDSRFLKENKNKGIANLIQKQFYIERNKIMKKRKKEIKINKRFVLSYTLFGNNKKFIDNVENVAKEASRLYPKWTVRIYYENISNLKLRTLSKRFKNLLFIHVRDLSLEFSIIKGQVKNLRNINARVWRFLPMGDENVDVMCSRDLDSEIYQREVDAVNDWLKTNKIFHVMRDYVTHMSDVMGGMWCFRNSKNRMKGQMILKNILKNAEKRYPNEEADKSNDQDLLNKFLWNETKEDCVQHVSYNCEFFNNTTPFPSRRQGKLFVGCIRPCNVNNYYNCPEACRPKNHKDWYYC